MDMSELEIAEMILKEKKKKRKGDYSTKLKSKRKRIMEFSDDSNWLLLLH